MSVRSRRFASLLVAVAVGLAPWLPVPASAAASPTGWSALDRAILDIPTYRPGLARWVVTSRFDFWGTTDWYRNVVYINPDVPSSRLYDVAVHEWSHVLSIAAYGGHVARAKRAMRGVFGGSGLTAAERAADCMAIVQGAGWTYYTPCRSASWRHAARRLVNGQHI